MASLYAIAFLIVLFVLEVFYFKLANKFNIIDQPNERSSHTSITLRGGGIIFSIAGLLWFFFYGFQYPCFIAGLFLISLISFLDDLHTLNNKTRLSIHLLAVLLLFYQWGLFEWSWYWIPIALIFVIGTINAYNFMDGINGITGAYSFVTVCTLYYINANLVSFTSPSLLIIVILSLLVFNFFNFRKKAKCFAGDVGSISIAFLIVFFIGQLILRTGDFVYILLLLFYGLDTAITILFRLIRRENIFKAHRSHFYQFLANEKKWPHLLVSSLYFFVQLIINVLMIFFIRSSVFWGVLVAIITTISFLLIRFWLEGRKRLVQEIR